MCSQDSSLIVPPFGSGTGIPISSKGKGGRGGSSFGQGTIRTGKYEIQDWFSGQYDNQYGARQFTRDYLVDSGLLAQNSEFWHTWQTNGRYLQQVKRLPSFVEENEAAC